MIQDRRPPEIMPGKLRGAEADDLSSEKLRYAVRRAAEVGHTCQVWVTSSPNGDEIEVLRCEDTDRIGIGWQGNVWWLDADSAEEALRLWSAGEGRFDGTR